MRYVLCDLAQFHALQGPGSNGQREACGEGDEGKGDEAKADQGHEADEADEGHEGHEADEGA